MDQRRGDAEDTRGLAYGEMRRPLDVLSGQRAARTAQAPASRANPNQASPDPLRDASAFKFSEGGQPRLRSSSAVVFRNASEQG
jgi:hypothetical protein